MRITSGKERTVKISIDRKELEQVGKFCYLGSMITSDAKCHVEIRGRIAMGKDAFYKRKELLREKLNTNHKPEEANNQVYDMECGAVWIGNMEYEKGRYQKNRGFRDVDMA